MAIAPPVKTPIPQEAVLQFFHRIYNNYPELKEKMLFMDYWVNYSPEKCEWALHIRTHSRFVWSHQFDDRLTNNEILCDLFAQEDSLVSWLLLLPEMKTAQAS